jgi:hypothetical protein
MDIFLSYSSADRKVAEGLREELGRQGVTVWSDPGNSSLDWRGRMEDGIRSADAILVLVGPRDGTDEAQQLTWRAALEAVWQDPSKRLVPVLLKGAELPTFVHSASSGEIQAVQVENSRDLRSAAQAISEVVSGSRGVDRSFGVSYGEPRSRSAFSFSVPQNGREERLARLSEMKQAVESLKP